MNIEAKGLEYKTPNLECELICPVIDADRIAAQTECAIAKNDLERHRTESSRCSGVENIPGANIRRCPLFGVTADAY